ncbi:MAG: putative rane protein, partial [Microbacteriaceae bacterium]|nr:putative rane protein [Microbacteriaceae bacterium]
MLRIVAAALVIVSHSFLLPSGGEPYPLSFGGYGYTMGRIGVIVFFVISGYLVCGSWLAEPRVRRYAGKRARRLYPALFVMVLLVTLVMGPIVTTSKAYFADPQTWFFLVRNLLIFPYDY